MSETQSTYWCHMCNRRIVLGHETIECPFCNSGFIEQMGSTIATSAEGNQVSDDYFLGGEREIGPDENALSLWAPVLLEMISNPHRRRRFRRLTEFEYEDNDEEHTESFTHTRRRNLATMLQILQGIRTGTISENGNMDLETRDRDPVILINPLNQTVIVQNGIFHIRDDNPGGSLGDYFVGPSLDLLLQHLMENDPNRHGTPPAKKEAVEAMPMVKIKEDMRCTVCLDDFEIGTEAKEMPCKHKFHDECILPWLELHSSCPVCRYQLPCDGIKIESDTNTNNGINSTNTNDDNSSSNGEERNGRENRRGFSWSLADLFSSSGNRGSSSSSSTRNEPSTDEN